MIAIPRLAGAGAAFALALVALLDATGAAQLPAGGAYGVAFPVARARVEALLGQDQLDEIDSIATTADARLRSALEHIRGRKGAYRRREALTAVVPIWNQSVRQIDAILSPQQVSELEAVRERFRVNHPRLRESDPPLGREFENAPRSNDIGGFVLRVMLPGRPGE